VWETGIHIKGSCAGKNIKNVMSKSYRIQREAALSSAHSNTSNSKNPHTFLEGCGTGFELRIMCTVYDFTTVLPLNLPVSNQHS
jgi:hypothetical protein